MWSKPQVPRLHRRFINCRCAAISDLRNVIDGLLRDASPVKPRLVRVACAGRGRQSMSIRATRAHGQARYCHGLSFRSMCFKQRLQTRGRIFTAFLEFIKDEQVFVAN